jgi:hypothetical protein
MVEAYICVLSVGALYNTSFSAFHTAFMGFQCRTH